MNSEVAEIVIADDEEHLRASLTWAFEKEGWAVSAFADGAAAWDYLRDAPTRNPRLIVLDIMMPRMDGLELCRKIRGIDVHVPLLFLSSRDEEFDRILGLELGADDYLCKPFSIRELVARIRVQLRRANYKQARESATAPTSTTKKLVCGALTVDPDEFRAFWKNQELVLTVSELRILISLATNAGTIKTREQLQHAAYPDDLYVNDRSVDCHIKRLRRKMENLDSQASLLETVYGLGYRLHP